MGTVNAACELCEFGTFQDKSGQTQCHYCENGGFADQAGMAECKFCQVWEYLQVEGISFNCRYCYTKEPLWPATAGGVLEGPCIVPLRTPWLHLCPESVVQAVQMHSFLPRKSPRGCCQSGGHEWQHL